MSSTIWTRDELLSSRTPLAAECWRVVEAQHRISTMKLVDSADEQAILEDILEATKPKIPDECRRLDYLLYTPFRYDTPYPAGSRFRRAGFTKGVFYASHSSLTAFHEMAFYRLLFYAESPATPFPANPAEYSAFAVPLKTQLASDLTVLPLARHAAHWTRAADYTACQDFADAARDCGVEVIRYASVRDPLDGKNFAVLSCRAFASRRPAKLQSWRMQIQPGRLWAKCEAPRLSATFDVQSLLKDPRLAPLRKLFGS